MAELQTRKTDPFHYAEYLSRAEQCLNAAKHSASTNEWDACAINSVQSAISAADALTVFCKSERSAGQRHEEAARLFKSIAPQDAPIQENANRLSRILAKKNASAYEEKAVKRNEAEYLLVEAGRLLDFVKTRLPRQ